MHCQIHVSLDSMNWNCEFPGACGVGSVHPESRVSILCVDSLLPGSSMIPTLTANPGKARPACIDKPKCHAL